MNKWRRKIEGKLEDIIKQVKEQKLTSPSMKKIKSDTELVKPPRTLQNMQPNFSQGQNLQPQPMRTIEPVIFPTHAHIIPSDDYQRVRTVSSEINRDSGHQSKI